MSRIWTQQPQVPVGVDWSNPITRGLLNAFTFSGNGARDVITGTNYGASSTMTPAASRLGIGYAHGSNTGINLPGKLQSGSNFTRVAVVSGVSAGVISDGKITGYAGAMLGYFSGSYAFNRHNEVGYLYFAAPGTGTVGVSIGSAVQTGWFDGVIKETRSGSVYFNNTGTGRLYSDGVGGADIAGSLLLHLDWKRALSDSEMASITSNPWQIFAPLPSRIFVGPATSGDTNLTVADSTHGHTAEEVTLTGVGSDTAVSVADSSHGHAVDAIALTAASSLVVADSTHAHYGDSPVLTNAAFLAVADGWHGHTSGNITLDGGIVLTVADSSHGHAVDEPSLTTASILAIQDALHSHAVENVILSGTSDVDLIIADALHAHAADNVTLTGDLTDAEKIDLILDILSNKQEIDPSTGLFTLYADDGSTVLLTASAWEDINGTVPYRGRGLKRLDALH